MKYKVTYSENSSKEYVEIYEIEAESEDEAKEKYFNGEGELVDSWSDEGVNDCGIESIELIED